MALLTEGKDQRFPFEYANVPSLSIREDMSKHLVDIDDDPLASATDVLGATTIKETVDRSLEEVVAHHDRRRHADRLATMEGLELVDPVVMSAAWR